MYVTARQSARGLTHFGPHPLEAPLRGIVPRTSYCSGEVVDREDCALTINATLNKSSSVFFLRFTPYKYVKRQDAFCDLTNIFPAFVYEKTLFFDKKIFDLQMTLNYKKDNIIFWPF